MRALAHLTLLAALLGSGAAGADETIKLATLVPSGSFWDRALREMGSDWESATEGRVKLRMYPGGVAGDDPDMVRKLRIGQLQAATVTVTGLTEIDPAFALFEVPGFFASYEELFHVVEALEPELERRLLARGFRLLHWGHAGWIHFFATRSVSSLAGFRDLEVFVWAGNDRMNGLWLEQGFRPVALSATDILMGLETELFQVLPSTPIAALSLQWFRSAPYMLDLPIAPLLGATILDEDVWQRLSAGDRAEVMRAAGEAGDFFTTRIPAEEKVAVSEMRRRGLEIVRVLGTAEEEKWRLATEAFAEAMREAFVPESIYDQALAARQAFRAVR